MSDRTTKGSENEAGRAFRRFLDELSELADVIDAEATDAVEQAEGYRHLLRLLSASSEWMLEKSDTDRPEFTRVLTPWRKFIGDNPDTFYDVAPVAAGATYRLRGHKGGALYLGATVYGRNTDGNIEMLGQASDTDFVDSTSLKASSAATAAPISGRSMYTTSPSASCA